MNFLFDLISLVLGLNKVDLFLVTAGALFWAGVARLDIYMPIKHVYGMILYTTILNMIAFSLGFVPTFWWAWGWNFVFLPVTGWIKPMVAISIVLAILVASGIWSKAFEASFLVGVKPTPAGCLNWPCTKFREYKPCMYGCNKVTFD